MKIFIIFVLLYVTPMFNTNTDNAPTATSIIVGGDVKHLAEGAVLLRCSKCNIHKPVTDFRKASKRKTGYQCWCKSCQDEDNKTDKSLARQEAYRKVTKKQAIKRAKEWYRNNKDKFSANQKRYYYKEVEKQWERQLKRKYGITASDYYSMLKNQNSLCAICGNEETDKIGKDDKPSKLSVDHNHETGKVRGLLCGNCNRMIGLSKEKIEVLTKAINYLNTHK